MKILILVAGYPGTGKTYMCNKILSKYNYFIVVSQDEIKESIFDKYGYNNIEERNKLTEYSREEYYKYLEDTMSKEMDIISDYPFSEKQKHLIEKLADKYNYDVITIRLIGDLEVLYKRQKIRDLDESRHLSHIMSYYHKGDILKNRSKADLLLSYEEFMSRCKNRGYGEFSIGNLLEVDVTNYESINYEEINKFIEDNIRKSSKGKVLCIGQSVYDITYPINEKLVENKKYRIYNKIECLGGPAANAAYLNAMWGNETYLISRVGNDIFGDKVLSTLRDIGVNTDYINICEEDTSISAIVTNLENGNRTIFNCPSSKLDIDFTYPKDVDVILVDGHELEASLKALEIFPKAKSIIDAGTYKPHLENLINKVEYLICSEDFANQYTGIEIKLSDTNSIEDTFKQLRILNKNNIIVTLGEKGLLYEKDDIIIHMPAFKAKAIDTTGAGDIFHGAFAYCISNGYSLEKNLQISSMASSISVEVLGGQTSIPSIKEVKCKISKYNN